MKQFHSFSIDIYVAEYYPVPNNPINPVPSEPQAIFLLLENDNFGIIN